MADFCGAGVWLSAGAGVDKWDVIEADDVGWSCDIATSLTGSFLEQPLVPKKKTPDNDATINEPTSAVVFCLPLSFFA